MLTAAEVKRLGRQAGFDIVRIATAGPFPEHMAAVAERKAKGWVPLEMERGYGAISDPKRSSDPRCLMPEAGSIISLGLGYYLRGEADRSSPGQPCGRLPRNGWRDLSGEAGRRRDKFVQYLEEHGARCAPAPDLPSKKAAERAGVAGYAKSGIVHAEIYGPWVHLVTVVTDVVLEADSPIEINCGSCRRCVDACPTKAIRAPFVLDASRCLAHMLASRDWLPVELRSAVGNRIYSCDQCLEVCPRALNPMMVDAPSPDRLGRWTNSPELLPLLKIGDEEFRQRFSYLDWYLADPILLKRNTIIALGNSGDLVAVPALIGMLESDEPILRGHAAWSLGRLGSADAKAALGARLKKEEDGQVRGEIELALNDTGRP